MAQLDQPDRLLDRQAQLDPKDHQMELSDLLDLSDLLEISRILEICSTQVDLLQTIHVYPYLTVAGLPARPTRPLQGHFCIPCLLIRG
jgi:hypothetical protein